MCAHTQAYLIVADITVVPIVSPQTLAAADSHHVGIHEAQRLDWADTVVPGTQGQIMLDACGAESVTITAGTECMMQSSISSSVIHVTIWCLCPARRLKDVTGCNISQAAHQIEASYPVSV